MNTEFERRQENPVDLEMIRPTRNSSRLAVVVLGIGLALAASYIAMDRSNTRSQTTMATNSPAADAAAPAEPTP